MPGSRNLGTLTLDLVLKLGGFRQGMDQAARISEQRLRQIRKNAEVVGRGIGLALTAGATAAAYAFKSSIDAADELSKASQKIGIPTEVLSQLKYAGELADVTLEQIQGGLGKLVKFQAGAAEGAKENIRTFKAFGIEIKDSQGNLRDTQSVLEDFADVFAALPDGPEKTALALRVFGKSGAELIPLLNEGKQGLREMGEEAKRLGVVIDTQTGKRAEQFNDNITRLETSISGLAKAVAADILPELEALTNEFVSNTTEGNNLASTAHSIGNAIRYLGETIQNVVSDVQALTSYAIGLYGVLEKISVLNPGPAIARLFGASTGNINVSEAFAMGNEAIASQTAPAAGASAKHAHDPRGPGAPADLAAHTAETEKALAATRALFSETEKATKSTKGKSDADRAAEEAAKRHRDAIEELQEQVKKTTEANAEFQRGLEDLAAAGNPLDQAQLQYKRDLEDLHDLAKRGEVSTTDLAKAEALLRTEYDKTTAEIQERLDTGGRVLKQMQQELDLLNLQTQAERDRAQFLIDNPTATGDQADAYARVQAQIDVTRQQISAMDELRDSASDAFLSIEDGSSSAIDALKNFGDAFAHMLEKMAADWLSSSLFGQPGTTGGGLFGNLFSSIFGSMLGGGSSTPSNFGIPGLTGLLPGFASGTSYAPGGWAMVGEQGPELVNLPRGAQVVPHRELETVGGSNFNQVNNFNLPRRIDSRSEMQIAQATERAGRIASRRNGR